MAVHTLTLNLDPRPRTPEVSMKKEDVDKLKGKSDGELAGYVLLTTHEHQNLLSQRDDTLTRIDKADKEAKRLQKEHDDECEELRKQVTDLEGKLADAETVLKELGGIEEASKVVLKKKRADAIKQLEDLDRQIKDLDGED